MQNVIVIGASGYLGSKVMESMIKRNLDIYAVKNNSPVNSPAGINVIGGGVNAITTPLLTDLQPDAIFHCGRPTYSRLKRFGRRLAARKAGKLNEKLVQNIKSSGIKTKLIFASGSLVYGSSDTPHNESSTLNPISYSKQYFKGELPILNEPGNDSLQVLTLRFPWLLGNGSWFQWFYLRNIREFGKIPLFGDGTNHMSIIDVRDAAELMVEYGVSDMKSGVYNIFSPDSSTQLEFVTIVSKIFDCDIVPYSELYPKLEKAALEAFTSNILLKTNYPKVLADFGFVNIKTGLKQIIQ